MENRLTVGELIELLSSFPKEKKVCVVADCLKCNIEGIEYSSKDDVVYILDTLKGYKI